MEFWSKGLGKKTINLSLAKGESLPSEGTVCLRGTMEEPVSWEYIMKLTGDDIVDFFALLKGPTMADYLFDSPHRWQLYKSMVFGGIRLGVLVAVATVVRALGREEAVQNVAIEVPPPSVRKKKTAKKKKQQQRPLRRRLTAHTTVAPTMHSTPAPKRAAGSTVRE